MTFEPKPTPPDEDALAGFTRDSADPSFLGKFVAETSSPIPA